MPAAGLHCCLQHMLECRPTLRRDHDEIAPLAMTRIQGQHRRVPLGVCHSLHIHHQHEDHVCARGSIQMAPGSDKAQQQPGRCLRGLFV